MFKPDKGTAVAPALSYFIKVEPSKAFAWLEGEGGANDTTSSAILAIAIVLANAADGKVDTQLKRACSLMFHGQSAKNLLADIKAKKTGDPSEAIFNRALAQVIPAKQWIVDLVTASKKKEIMATTVESYYSALGRTDVRGQPIARMINKAANFLRDDIATAAFREALTSNEFMRYHTSRVSTGGLLKEMEDVFIELNMFKGNDKDIVDEAFEAPYDVSKSKLIPTRLVGYAVLYFEVTGKQVGNWYQGKKALDDLPSVRISAIKEVFRKYIEIKNNLGNLEEVKSIDDLRDKVCKDLF